jgi:hypothetical protein
MVAWILWGAPDAGDTELATATFSIVVWAINPAPGVTTSDLDTPTAGLGVSKRFLNFLLRMSSSTDAGRLHW